MASIKKRVQSLLMTYKIRNIKALFDAALADSTAQAATVTELDTFVDSMRTFLTTDGIINPTVLSISATPEELAITAAQYRIDGVSYNVAADATLPITDADTINTAAGAGNFFGAWLVQVNAAGTLSTHAVGADQVYTSAALALAALPAPDALHVRLGYFIVNANVNSAWTAKTDDMTDASDCLTCTYVSDTTDVPAALTTPSSLTLTS